MARRQDDSTRQARGRFQNHSRRREKMLDQRLLLIIAGEGEKTERLYTGLHSRTLTIAGSS